MLANVLVVRVIWIPFGSCRFPRLPAAEDHQPIIRWNTVMSASAEYFMDTSSKPHSTTAACYHSAHLWLLKALSQPWLHQMLSHRQLGESWKPQNLFHRWQGSPVEINWWTVLLQCGLLWLVQTQLLICMRGCTTVGVNIALPFVFECRQWSVPTFLLWITL